MNLDWTRLRAVVLESDDWGLCAWSPDVQGWRALADQPVFRSPSGRRYAGSTLESAEDVRAMTDLLGMFRGGDGFPPVWQANMILAAPDYAKLAPPAFDTPQLPLLEFPNTPSRWMRPKLWEEITVARMSGLWWPELHGLHHLPAKAWLAALRRGVPDARRAFEHQSPVCAAVDVSGEYHPSEPAESRTRDLETAVATFRRLFGRLPLSMCPPDYRWDEQLERDAERLGITTFQGKGEQLGHAFPRLRRLLLRYRWPHLHNARFYLPIRIAFEPQGSPSGVRVGAVAVQRAAREAWNRGQPAVISSHRVNYVHLDAAAAEGGRAALRDLLHRLQGDNAVFLTDAEVRQLQERAWSVREVGTRGVLVRYYGVPREPVVFDAPHDATGVALREGRRKDGEVRLADGRVEARLNDGEYLLEWERNGVLA